jgi:hypothetical protein
MVVSSFIRGRVPSASQLVGHAPPWSSIVIDKVTARFGRRIDNGRMAGRADWSLELQLEQVEKVAVASDVKDAIRDVVRHMNGGKSRHRRGGHALIRLLKIARLRASEESEWDVVRLLQDSIDYADDRIIKSEFEERYRLFQDGARNKSDAGYLGKIIHAAHSYTYEVGKKYVEENPGTTSEELLSYLASVGEDAKYLDAPEDRPGRYRLSRPSRDGDLD